MNHGKLAEKIKKYLTENSTVVLSSTLDGIPWAAAVFYVNDDYNLYFFSDPNSRHSRNFAVNPKAAATVNDHYWEWQEIRGLQMEGQVEHLKSVADKTRAMALYFKKFPFVKQFFDSPLEISKIVADKVSDVIFYCFTPSEIYFIDNSEGFGKRKKFTP